MPRAASAGGTTHAARPTASPHRRRAPHRRDRRRRRRSQRGDDGEGEAGQPRHVGGMPIERVADRGERRARRRGSRARTRRRLRRALRLRLRPALRDVDARRPPGSAGSTRIGSTGSSASWPQLHQPGARGTTHRRTPTGAPPATPRAHAVVTRSGSSADDRLASGGPSARICPDDPGWSPGVHRSVVAARRRPPRRGDEHAEAPPARRAAARRIELTAAVRARILPPGHRTSGTTSGHRPPARRALVSSRVGPTRTGRTGVWCPCGYPRTTRQARSRRHDRRHGRGMMNPGMAGGMHGGCPVRARPARACTAAWVAQAGSPPSPASPC